jgi:hypothetical protein
MKAIAKQRGRAKLNDLLKAVFSARSVPRLCIWWGESIRVQSDSRIIQLRVAEAYSWERWEFENTEEGKRPPLEAATYKRSEDRDWER